jgi:hydrogenase maturation protein HypF
MKLPSPSRDARARRVLATGAWLKNAACLLTIPAQGAWTARWSAAHGDLSTPEACDALRQSLEDLVATADGPLDAIAHDLHPDFHSTRLAVDWAARLGVPAIGVQHHLAHVAVVMADAVLAGRADPTRPVIGIALDGVGLGTDGQPWGGELLQLDAPEPLDRIGSAGPPGWRRIGHLAPIALAGGDVAAREPWRLAAAVLVGLDRDAEVERRFGPTVGPTLARGVTMLLRRGVQAPLTTSAGRWFDAAAAALGLHPRQHHEAEAAMALEALADTPGGHAELAKLASNRGPAAVGLRLDPMPDPQSALRVIDLAPTVAELFALHDAARAGDDSALARGAALFHHRLAEGLAAASCDAAQASGADTVMLGGGCFLNRVLSRLLQARLLEAGLQALRPHSVGVGDAGLALGQAWIAAREVQAAAASFDTPFAEPATALDATLPPHRRRLATEENPLCA